MDMITLLDICGKQAVLIADSLELNYGELAAASKMAIICDVKIDDIQYKGLIVDVLRDRLFLDINNKMDALSISLQNTTPEKVVKFLEKSVNELMRTTTVSSLVEGAEQSLMKSSIDESDITRSALEEIGRAFGYQGN